jgi:hypothetical protein
MVFGARLIGHPFLADVGILHDSDSRTPQKSLFGTPIIAKSPSGSLNTGGSGNLWHPQTLSGARGE